MNFAWIPFTGSQVISKTPSLLGGVIISPSGDSKKCNITLYDGESSADPKIIEIYSGTGTTKMINFQPYMQTHRGLYIEVSGSFSTGIVQLIWDKE